MAVKFEKAKYDTTDPVHLPNREQYRENLEKAKRLVKAFQQAETLWKLASLDKSNKDIVEIELLRKTRDDRPDAAEEIFIVGINRTKLQGYFLGEKTGNKDWYYRLVGKIHIYQTYPIFEVPSLANAIKDTKNSYEEYDLDYDIDDLKAGLNKDRRISLNASRILTAENIAMSYGSVLDKILGWFYPETVSSQTE